MKIGLILPTFAPDLQLAEQALNEIATEGFNGAFVYDHLWPMHHRERPAIAAFPALGALSAHRREVTLGTLVARMGNVAPQILVRELRTAAALCSGDFIAGLGTGDHLSAEEYEGYGLRFGSAAERQGELTEVARTLLEEGIEVWVGGGSPSTDRLTRDLGVTLNLWGKTPEEVAERARILPTSWAGILPGDEDGATHLLRALAGAGTSWAVFAWPGKLDLLAGARAAAGLI